MCIRDRFGEVRTISKDGEPYFVGKDVADILGYANPNEAIHDHVDEEDKLNSKSLSSFTLDLGQRGGWLINESGLYSLIMGSKLPQAKQFKRWVTSEAVSYTHLAIRQEQTDTKCSAHQIDKSA